MTEQKDLSSYGQLDKEELIEKIMQLQQTLHDLTSRIDQVRNDNLSLKDENMVLKEYINNLMTKTGNLPNQG
jgi:FtsZ-binding cell division protein ZapB